ncbi:MAG TPA: Flp pilus assembly protein CpaB [Candidatus Tumulicola sp.]|jgi:pilus assembly protein CpaB
MNTRRTTLLIAVILAIGTGWLTYSYVSSLRSAGGKPSQVLIAAVDIPAREAITDAMFRVETRPASALQPDAISDPAKAVGNLALVTIPAGSQITASQVGSNAALALPVRLQPGMRAVSIPIDQVKGVAGLIQPGDRVDVIAIPPKTGDVPPRAVTILRGVRVLAVGNALESPSATPSPQEQGAGTVTLEVNPKQANLLAWADADSNLRLALRSPKEPIRSEPVEQLTFGSSSAPISLPPPAPVPPVTAMSPLGAPGAASARRASPYGPVEVIIGDQVAGAGSN